MININKKIISMAIIATLFTGIGSTSVFASSSSTTAKKQVKTISSTTKSPDLNKRGPHMQGDQLQSLVTAGTITAAQKTAITNALSAARGSNKDIKTTLDALVTAGTITSAQETAVLNAMKPSDMNKKGHHGDELKSLVTAGTITEAQKTAITNALDAAKGANKDIKTTLDALVTTGTITSAQETAVLSSMKSSDMMDKKGHHGNELESLITAGTITEAQKTAITNALDAARGSNTNTKTTLDALVTAGTITSAQETAVLNAMKPF